MRKYHVTGMSCAACSARVEAVVKAVPGVTSCTVSLLTNSMAIEGDAEDEQVIKAVEEAGYGASCMAASVREAEAALEDERTGQLKKRLLLSVVFLAVLMYIAMGYGMWGWPMMHFLEVRPIMTGCIEALLAALVVLINQEFFVSGFKGVMHKAPNMNTLVALGSGAAYLYSLCVLIIMMGEQEAGQYDLVAEHLRGLYFDSAAMILTLITVGKLLEAYSRGRTTDALKGLMRLSPQEAVLLRDGKQVKVPTEYVAIGDTFVVKPGELIPVDGIVLEGTGAIDESALTGESIPVEVTAGSAVKSASINCESTLICRATRVGEDTTLAQIIRLVSEASASKAPIAKTADKVARIFVPAVLAIAVVTAAAWLFAGRGIGFALARAISVLVISCPCAMGLATPVAIMVGSGIGARYGILFKTAASLEAAGRIEQIALDKTGTITAGEPKVTGVMVLKEELLSVAGALESMSEHPMAKAVTAYVEEIFADDEAALTLPAVTEFHALPGNGIEGMINGCHACAGSYRFISQRYEMPGSLKDAAQDAMETGQTPLLFAKDEMLLGMITVADTMKPDSPAAIRALKQLGLEVIMLTGDNGKTAERIGEKSGVDRVIAGILPDEKADEVRKLQSQQKLVAMVGDGINDAPALMLADTGIAIGAGADVAVDAADIVLMKGSLMDVPAMIRLSRKVLLNIKENLFWAFIYNLICIPLAAGAFTTLFGWTLSPMIAAACMSLSSICVVLNALRLNLFNPYDNIKDHAVRQSQKKQTALKKEIGAQGKAAQELPEARQKAAQELPETRQKTAQEKERAMKQTLKVEGMMCPHCEAFVKKTLEAIPGVASAVADHQAKTAIVELTEEVPVEVLKQAVTDAGYTCL